LENNAGCFVRFIRRALNYWTQQTVPLSKNLISQFYQFASEMTCWIGFQNSQSISLIKLAFQFTFIVDHKEHPFEIERKIMIQRSKQLSPADSNEIDIPNWESDYESRVNPELMTRLLHQAVPVLKATEWGIISVEPGFAQSMLPLNHETTNQHGTHQAALISLSADYTGGMAFATLLSEAPLAGIHKSNPEKSASLWLISMNVRYLKPSTGHVVGTCQVPNDLAAKICKRYRQGKRVAASLVVDFHSNGDLVAQGELKYFAQPTRTLLGATDGKRSPLFNQKLKASARMIAGIRAASVKGQHTEGLKFGPGQWVRYDQGHSSDFVAAGPHGVLLAEKMAKKLPQLTSFVASRTQHIDELIESTKGLKQLVFAGVGLDMRAFRHARSNPAMKVFELDLPEMLIERERVLKQSDFNVNLERHTISADFLKDDIAQSLLSNSRFDPTQKTVFVFEGCSMYFQQHINERILRSIQSLMQHPDSKVWCDFVDEGIVNGDAKHPQIAEFLNAMEDLGESFIFGKTDPAKFLTDLGFSNATSQTTRSHLEALSESKEGSDQVLECYRMCVASNSLT
jgi:methyltransferase (TIGR00027 family)